MAKSTAERAAEYKARMEKAGLVRLQLWVPRGVVNKFKQMASMEAMRHEKRQRGER